MSANHNLLLRLQALDEQLADWEQQRQRDGLSAYRERQRTLQARFEQRLQLEEVVAQATLEEDQLLEAMYRLDALPMGMLQREQEELEAEMAEAGPEEEERLQALDQRLLAGYQQRQLLAQELGETAFGCYQRARQRHGRALEEVKSGRCPRCRMQLSDHEQRQLRLGQGIPCSTCQVMVVASLLERPAQSR